MVIRGIFVAILTPVTAWAAPDTVPDPNATVIHLRTNCDIANSNANESPLENCFESMAAVKSWIYDRTNPSARLLVDIGPGTFGPFGCTVGDAPGNVGGELTFRGAGAGKTVLDGAGSGSIAAVANNNCVGPKWIFEDMTLKGTYTVVWFGGGESTWNNVVIDGSNAAWYDAVGGSGAPCAEGQQGTHRFFSSQLKSAANGGFGFLNACGDNWFWGSEVFSINGAGNRVHLYGSNVRIEASASAGSSGSLTAITVSNNGELHSHGVGIDVVGKPGWTLTAISASAGASVHANVSSYFMAPSTGATLRRIVNNNGHVHAPYLWEEHPTPPAIQSVDGADIAVVTSGTSDNHPHMVVYDSSCSSKWYDMVDKACRP
jgi:hypothetical protein